MPFSSFVKANTKNFNIQVVENFVEKHYFSILFIIALFAAVLRFYNFWDNFSFRADTWRDIAIAKEALSRREVPLVGSFSSAGPFVFGPLFYWFIMLSYLILPFWLFAPWVLIGSISLVIILVFAYLGKIVAGRIFSLMLAFLAAISPQLVSVSLSLTQHSFVIAASAATLVFFVLLWIRKKFVFAFLMGICAGVALSMHWQSLNLLLILGAILFAPLGSLRNKIIAFLYSIFAILVVSIPLLLWDSSHDWANTRNLLDYLLIVQYRRYVPNSWHLFLGDYFPILWASSVGGFKLSGMILIFMTGFSFCYFTLRKKIEQPLFALGLVFFALAFLYRYYRGERFEGYLFYFTPFILLFATWSIYKMIFEKIVGKGKVLKIFIGVVLLILVVFGNFKAISGRFKPFDEETQLEKMRKVMMAVEQNYFGKKYVLWEFKKTDKNVLRALAVFLEDASNPSGEEVAFGYCGPHSCPGYAKIMLVESDIILVKIEPYYLLDPTWTKSGQAAIYDETIGWLHEGNLKSDFHLGKYILQKIGLQRFIPET